MTLNRQYRQAILYPFVAVILCTLIYSTLDNYNYKSEWLTAGSVIFLSVIWAFLYSLIISGFALTIFLNKFEKVRTNNLLVILSWFLLPFSFIGVIINHEITFEMKYESGKLGSDFIYVLILNVPFTVGLIWSYFKYRKINRA